MDAGAVKTILEFYQALGIDKLPIAVPGFKGNPGAAAQDRGRCLPAEAAKALEALRAEIGDCDRCRLSKGRSNLVFGEGNPCAELMFIGEAPGREEDSLGRPFVGEAGKLLTSLIERMGLSREDVYIANIAKCRPDQNRDPQEDEIAACMPFIKRQIAIISPKIIVSLGRISAQNLLNTKIPISKLRGKFYEFEGISLMPTFHPAYLLRNPKDKWLVWEDALKVLERLGKRPPK